MGADVAAALAEIELEAWDGQSQRLSELWRERDLVLVFVRHFG